MSSEAGLVRFWGRKCYKTVFVGKLIAEEGDELLVNCNTHEVLINREQVIDGG